MPLYDFQSWTPLVKDFDLHRLDVTLRYRSGFVALL